MSDSVFIRKYCYNCGARIKDTYGPCPSCGRSADVESALENIERVGAGGVGYSDITEDASFSAYKKHMRRMIRIGGLVVFVITFVASLFMGFGLLGGIALGMFLFICILISSFTINRKKKSWEGAVTGKNDHEVRRDKGADYHSYVAYIKTNAGKTKTVVWRDNSNLYNYLQEGDRVRYVGDVGGDYAFEKYDKSKDEKIPCVCCGYMMDPRYKYCTMCGALLMKGRTTEFNA